MTVEELIEALRQIPGNCYVYTYTDRQCVPALSVVAVDDQPGGTSYVVIS